MRTIKTRSSVKNIKVLDKSVNLSKRMKDTYLRTKERAEETRESRHDSPAEYASENIQNTARDTAHHLPNPAQKARDNWSRAKEHFGEVKRQMPGERRYAAEQAQNTASKAKTNAENLRQTADKVYETARDTRSAVNDAKTKLREVRQHGRQTMREVKQSASFEQRGQQSTSPNVAHRAGQESVFRKYTPSDLQRQRGIQRLTQQRIQNTAPKNALDTAKPLQSSAASTGQTVKSTKNAFKETAKGTVKTVKKSVKTAEQSAKTGVKTAKHTAKTAQKTAHTAAKTAKAAERAARAAAKTAAQVAKAAAKAVAAMVKIAIAAVKGLIAAIAAGGWTAVLVILIICMIGVLLGSAFGIFFSSESGVSENGMTMKAAVSQINAEYAGELVRIQQENPHDTCEISASRSPWKEILAVYAVKTSTDPENPLDVLTLDDEKIGLLRTVFWDMTIIDYRIEEIEHEAENEDEEDWTERILLIAVTGKTAADMALEYGFDTKQTEMLEELLLPEYDNLWASLLAGASSGGGMGTISLGIYIWPSNDSDAITSYFGGRINPVTGKADNHTGIDIAAGDGTAILAAADGTVVTSSFNDGGYGNYVVIDHGDGNRTLYGHMSSRGVSAGDIVTQGQVIGYVGSTGMSTGPHIHFETIVNGFRVDPLLYFDNNAGGW